MALQNRVTPFGEIVADPARGLFMGNRGGRLHDPSTKTLTRRRWASKAWICCVTSFKNRRRPVMGAGYTELFFLDEVTALASGHRPCFECRRRDAVEFATLWGDAAVRTSRMPAPRMDEILHRERLAAGCKTRHARAIDDLPDGVMIVHDEKPRALRRGRLWLWTHQGYVDGGARPDGRTVEILTPPSIVSVLRAGYEPVWHPSAGPPF